MSKRLLIISSEFPPGPGGIGNHAHQLAVHLRPLGWQSMILSPQDYATPDEVQKFNADQPFRVVTASSGGGQLGEALKRLRVAGRLVREYKPDVLVGSGRSGVWISAMTAAIRRLPCVAIAHGSEFGRASAWVSTINRRAFQRMNLIVAVSRFTHSLVERAGIKPRRLEVITNAADHSRYVMLSKFDLKEFRKRSELNGDPLLVTVGHVSERKGQEVVIRALPEVLKHFPHTQYAMIGLPTLKPKLIQLAEQLGVAQNVRFLGKLAGDDVVRWLNCCDAFVMTSRTTSDGDCEGFGIAVVEAALCGKPAVVSAQSGLTEAIEDGVTGVAVAEGDAQATAKALISLLSDPGRRQAMGEVARDRALRDQTWETCARKYDLLLRSLEISNSVN